MYPTISAKACVILLAFPKRQLPKRMMILSSYTELNHWSKPWARLSSFKSWRSFDPSKELTRKVVQDRCLFRRPGPVFPKTPLLIRGLDMYRLSSGYLLCSTPSSQIEHSRKRNHCAIDRVDEASGPCLHCRWSKLTDVYLKRYLIDASDTRAATCSRRYVSVAQDCKKGQCLNFKAIPMKMLILSIDSCCRLCRYWERMSQCVVCPMQSPDLGFYFHIISLLECRAPLERTSLTNVDVQSSIYRKKACFRSWLS